MVHLQTKQEMNRGHFLKFSGNGAFQGAYKRFCRTLTQSCLFPQCSLAP